MGKRSGKKREKRFQTPVNQRGGGSGRKKCHSLKSVLKVQHLRNLATWASEKASIPPLGAFFGRQFAACSEAFGIAPDPSVVSCQRCETILQPGFNCTIRIVKNRQQKTRRRGKKKPNVTTKNNVIYTCHFCSYENVKRGTSKGHMQNICPSIPKATPQPVTPPPRHDEAYELVTASLEDSSPSNSELAPQQDPPSGSEVLEDAATSLKNDTSGKDDNSKEEEQPSINTSPGAENPSTPAALKGLTLLNTKRKRGKSKAKKPPDESAGTTGKEQDGASSRKKRKKGWTSLKEIAQSNVTGKRKSFANLSVPFSL